MAGHTWLRFRPWICLEDVQSCSAIWILNHTMCVMLRWEDQWQRNGTLAYRIRSFRHLWVGMKHHISKYPPPTQGVLLCLKAFNWHTSYHWQKARKSVKLVVGKTSLIFNTSPVINYRERNESNCICYDWIVSFLHYFPLCERLRLYQTF